MDVLTVVSLVKERIGIKTRLVLDGTNPYHLMFVVDYATWRYQSRDSDGAMPRHLQFRLHNLMIHAGGGASDV